jgi:hypothetical protein
LEHQEEKRAKTGGRQKGTPNKTASFVRELFAGVIEEAFNETAEGKAARELLILKIRMQELDPKLVQLFLAYAAGAPPKEHKVTGKLTLEQLVTGVKAADDEGDE